MTHRMQAELPSAGINKGPTGCFGALAVLTIVAMASGCSTLERNPDARTGWVDVPVRFITSTGTQMAIQDRPSEWFNALGIIPGGIVGTTHHTYSLLAEEMHDYDVQVSKINFSNLRTGLARQSTTISAAAIADGLRIEPADTRFGRVTTIISDTDKKRGPYGTGFRDGATSKQSLILAYFDRPCRLTGTLGGTSADTVAVDVTIKQAGLAWLKVSDSRLTTAEVPSDLMFVVQSRRK